MPSPSTKPLPRTPKPRTPKRQSPTVVEAAMLLRLEKLTVMTVEICQRMTALEEALAGVLALAVVVGPPVTKADN